MVKYQYSTCVPVNFFSSKTDTSLSICKYYGLSNPVKFKPSSILYWSRPPTCDTELRYKNTSTVNVNLCWFFKWTAINVFYDFLSDWLGVQRPCLLYFNCIVMTKYHETELHFVSCSQAFRIFYVIILRGSFFVFFVLFFSDVLCPHVSKLCSWPSEETLP